MNAANVVSVLYVVIGLAFAIAILLIAYQSARTKREKKRDQPTHQRWPEVLHWQKGDRFERTFSLRYTRCKLVAVREDGFAIVDFWGDRDCVPVSALVGCNVSLRTRRVNQDLHNSNEYMELLQEFNKAVAELEERDKRLKLAG